MKTMSALAQLALALTVAAAPAPAASAAPCPAYLLIDSRGTFELQGESIGFKPMIASTMAAIPNGARHDTVYPAAPDVTQETTYIGVDDVLRTINAGLAACPAQRYALLGYSQGATVTNEVLQRIAPDSATASAVRAVVLIGNPYHLPNRQGNVDENGGSSTAGATGSLVGAGGPREVPDAWYATGKVLDICYTNDAVCVGFNQQDAFNMTHLDYGFSDSVQREGAAFLEKMLA